MEIIILLGQIIHEMYDNNDRIESQWRFSYKMLLKAEICISIMVMDEKKVGFINLLLEPRYFVFNPCTENRDYGRWKQKHEETRERESHGRKCAFWL